MKLLSILILFTTAVAAAALDSSGDQAVLDLEETPTLRGLKSRNCDGVGPNTCDNRSNCIWIDDRSRRKQQRQGRHGRNRSNGWCEDRDSGYHDHDSCRRIRSFKKCRNSNYCRWSNSEDGCVDRDTDYDDPIPLRQVANDGSPKRRYPLGLCEGDCDSDKDCAAGLKCMKRSNYERVPGCSGSHKFKETDFCIEKDPPDDCPELSRNRCTSRSNRYFCKWKNGRCRYRSLPDHFEPIPLQRVGNDGSPSRRYPLGLCEGDCDSDKDCEAGLECMQRSNYERVPGCSGSHKFKTTDFCIEKDRGRRSNECVRSSECHGDKKCRWRNGRWRCILL